MTRPNDAVRPPPSQTGSLRVSPAVPPRTAPRPSPPLVVWGPNDDLRINPRHPGAPFAWVLYALAVPLVMLARAANHLARFWHGRRERAALRRQNRQKPL